ncbi:MAG: tRNA pseudouridine(38-40) synthase TruA [Paludibacter sp.]
MNFSVNKRYFIYLSYNGTNYHGWQMQPNGISVQEVLSKALFTVLRIETEITGAGRTDTGVHARLMVAHFETEVVIDDLKLLANKLNSILPHDISVSKICKVNLDAHARFEAISRKYEYHIVTEKSVFQQGLAARFSENLDMELMNDAAKMMFQYTDFTSFSKLHTDVKTNNCVIKQAFWERRENTLVFTIEADRFLRNMVRAIVGTLLEVGRGKITIDDFNKIIEAKNRCKAGTSVPACGLYLVDIKYPDNIFI